MRSVLNLKKNVSASILWYALIFCNLLLTEFIIGITGMVVETFLKTIDFGLMTSFVWLVCGVSILVWAGFFFLQT